jgi:hypothetical protein
VGSEPWSDSEETRISYPELDEETRVARAAPAAAPADIDLERTRITGKAEDESEHTVLRGRRIGTPTPVVAPDATGEYRAPSVEPGARVAYTPRDASVVAPVSRVILSAPTERSRLSASPSELREAAQRAARRRARTLVISLALSVVLLAGAIVAAVIVVSSGALAPSL